MRISVWFIMMLLSVIDIWYDVRYGEENVSNKIVLTHEDIGKGIKDQA